MKIALTILLILGFSKATVMYGQTVPQVAGDDQAIISVFEENDDSTVYTAMQRIISGTQPISYLSPVFLTFSPVQRVVPLRFGEGQRGYILEASVDQSFALLQGRSQMDHFVQTSRVSIHYAPAIRLTKDNSSNLLPTNQKIGIQADKVLWDSYTRNFFTDRRHERFEFADDNDWLRAPHDLHMLHLSVNAMHFSNGQASGVYASAADSVLGRNDYLKGDFSTNYINLSLIYSYYNNYLLSAALGYQQDGDWGGPFSFIDEQQQRYGKKRITGFLQYRSQPVQNLLRRSFTVKDIYHQRSYEVKRLVEHRLRLEGEYTAGSMARFKRSQANRLSAHLYYELSPLRSRTVGFMLHVFYGRDYMNIRYDDVVFAAMAGITLSLNKYRHPRFNANKYIIRSVEAARFEKLRQTSRDRKIKY